MVICGSKGFRGGKPGRSAGDGGHRVGMACWPVLLGFNRSLLLCVLKRLQLSQTWKWESSQKAVVIQVRKTIVAHKQWRVCNSQGSSKGCLF